MAKKPVTLEVQLDVKDVRARAQELSNVIEKTLEGKSTSNPRLAKVMQGLEHIQEKIYTIDGVIKNLSGEKLSDIQRRIDALTVSEAGAKKELEDYLKYLQEIGKGGLVESFKKYGAIGENLDKAYFGKNRTKEIEEYIQKLKQLEQAKIDASRSLSETKSEMWFAKTPQFSDSVLSGETGQQIAKGFQDAIDTASILILKYNELIKKDAELNGGSGGRGGAGDRNSFRGNFYFARTILNDVNRGLTKVSDGMKRFMSNVGNCAKKMMRLGKESTKTTDTLKNGFKNALRNIMRYGLGVRSLYFLFRRLRGYAKEALQEMAKAFPEVNQQMSRAVTALNQMKGAIGTAVQPLLNILIPVLEKVAALVVKVANLIGSLFAMLTGQKTIYQAVAVETDYAASLDKTGSAAKKAKKELEGYLSPIDEINKYKSKDDDTSGGGAGGGGLAYEAVPVADLASKLKAYLDRLINPIKKAWAEVGDFVKKSWKYAWDEILKLGKSVARDFWKMWDEDATVLVFKNILETIGWIGQAVGNLAKRFREAWDENNTGLNILRAIRNIVLTITNHIKNMAKATAEWADSLDFGPLLTKLEEWLRSIRPVIDSIAGILEDFYTKVLLPLGKWALEKGLPDLLQVFIDFNEKVDWDELRDRLAEFWEHLEPFTEKVGEGLIAFIGDLSDKLADFINSESFENLLIRIEDWMDSVTAEDVESTFGTLARVLPGVAIGFTLLKNAASGLSSLMPVIGMIGKLSGALGGAGAAGGAAAGGEAAGGLAESAAAASTEWEAFCASLAGGGIEAEAAGGAVEGTSAAVGGLGASIGAAAAAVAVLVAAFITLWNTSEEFRNNIKSTFEDLKKSFKDFFGTSGSELKEFVSVLKQGFKDIVAFVKPVWNDFCKFLSPLFQNAFKKISDTLKNTFQILQGALQLFIGIFTGDWEKAWNGVVSIFKGCVNEIASNFERIIKNICSTVNYFIEGINKISVGGKSPNVPLIPTDWSIPRLAQGAVIPPNKEFMATLGDQKSGTNIETPLQTMVDAFNMALSQNGGSGRTEINFLLPDRRKIAQYVLEGGRIMQTSTGKNPFELA